MRSRYILGFVFMFTLAAIFVATFLQLSPDLLRGIPQDIVSSIKIGLLIGVALILVIGNLVIVQIFARDEDQANYNPLAVARDLVQHLNSQSDESALVETICAMLEEVLTVKDSGWLWLRPQANDLTLTPAASPSRLEAPPMVFARGNSMLQILSQQRKPLFHSTLVAEETYRHMAPSEKAWLERLRADVYVPICSGDQITAILAVGPKRDRRPFSRTDLEFLPVVASVAASRLQAARAVADLQTANAALATRIQALQKTNEEMTTMGSAKNDFISIVSHELKTPVTQVLGFADFLSSMAQDNALDAHTIADITHDIVKACLRLGEVITQMLEMAQLDVNAVSLNYHETSLEAILKQAVEPYVAAVRDRQLKLSVRGLRQVPPLLADEERLAGAFAQIVSNAIKYTPDGGRIDIAARLLPGENDQGASAEITIADTGIGIAPQQQSLIFEKFYRVGSTALHSTSTTKFMGGGPGLGLPVARGIIEKHGGRIWVESPGHDPAKFPGSRFFIHLPLQPPAFNAASNSAPVVVKPEAKKEVTFSPTQSPFIEQ
jgi:signal transduction histidine kinase